MGTILDKQLIISSCGKILQASQQLSVLIQTKLMPDTHKIPHKIEIFKIQILLEITIDAFHQTEGEEDGK